MSNSSHRVAVLGATDKPERFANKAILKLVDHGYSVVPIHPKLTSIAGLPVMPSLSAIAEPIDTLTLYVGPDRLNLMYEEIIAARPARVIFNPGTESRLLQQELDKHHIPWQENCTLVLLDSGRF